MDSNITIRTLVHHKDKMYCWAGGGIVMDSRLDAEYQECFDKVAAIFALFAKENL
jgi:para-aminobenzoate synthetase component 1